MASSRLRRGAVFVLNGDCSVGREQTRGLYAGFGFGADGGGYSEVAVDVTQCHVGADAVVLELMPSGGAAHRRGVTTSVAASSRSSVASSVMGAEQCVPLHI